MFDRCSAFYGQTIEQAIFSFNNKNRFIIFCRSMNIKKDSRWFIAFCALRKNEIIVDSDIESRIFLKARWLLTPFRKLTNLSQ